MIKTIPITLHGKVQKDVPMYSTRTNVEFGDCASRTSLRRNADVVCCTLDDDDDDYNRNNNYHNNHNNNSNDNNNNNIHSCTLKKCCSTELISLPAMLCICVLDDAANHGQDVGRHSLNLHKRDGDSFSASENFTSLGSPRCR